MTSEHGSNQPGSGERSRLAHLSDADNVNPAHRTEIERRARRVRQCRASTRLRA